MGQHHRAVPQEGEGDDLSEADAHEAAGGADTGTDAAADDAWLERGRVLFAGPWRYVRSCHAIDQLPVADGLEAAFAGRSNVGKSSLINALVGQKGLAKASNTPGRTRALNLFAREDGVGPVLVDMPGYGYAKAPKSEVADWTDLVFRYLRGRPNLARVYLLIDARHGIKPGDEAAMSAMDEAAVSYQAVLTKADKNRPALQRLLEQTAAALKRRPAAFPSIIATSAEKGEGLADLRAAIAQL